MEFFFQSDPLSIRPLVSLKDMDLAVTLQKNLWSYTDLDVDSPALLVVASRFAGQILGAFDGERLIGMALAFFAQVNGRVRLHSHRVGVLAQYQNRGIGKRLKLAQRGDALARGVEVMQWTFDPLQPRNAFFNLERLGGIVRTYIPNLYGVTSSPMHGGLPTDRLLVEWELKSSRVEQTLSGTLSRNSATRRVLLPEPADRNDLAAQSRLREELETLFGKEYAITGFDRNDKQPAYLLEKA